MKEKNNNIIVWIFLVLLIISTLILTYIKYFSFDNTSKYINEIPINESSSVAIHDALNKITKNFNESTRLKEYELENNIKLNATVNNYSIFISYIKDTTTTYEFKYEDLFLNIVVNNIEFEKEKFNIIYKFLIEAVQKRINNSNDINGLIDMFLSENINIEGLSRIEYNNTIKYQMDITKKIE